MAAKKKRAKKSVKHVKRPVKRKAPAKRRAKKAAKPRAFKVVIKKVHRKPITKAAPEIRPLSRAEENEMAKWKKFLDELRHSRRKRTAFKRRGLSIRLF